VAAGVALELVEPIHDGIAWIKKLRLRKRELADLKEVAEFVPVDVNRRSNRAEPKSDHPTWVKSLGRIGIILVVAGVVGEWRYGGKLEDAHNTIHKYDVALLGDAAKSAKTAHDEADAVKIESDALKMRMDVASVELDGIEYRTLLLGPRDKLLFGKRRQKLVDALQPFARQNIDVRVMAVRTVILGGRNPSASDFKERDGLANSLIGVLNDANWNPPNVLSKDSTLAGDGISVHLFPDAPSSTSKAAEVLAKALASVPLATSGPTSDLTTAEETDKSAIVLVVHLR
jgi:hypothetical protein